MPKPQGQGNPTRRVFASPYNIKWPEITEDQKLKITETLKDILPPIPPKKPKPTTQKKPKKKKFKNPKEPQAQNTTPSSATSLSTSTTQPTTSSQAQTTTTTQSTTSTTQSTTTTQSVTSTQSTTSPTPSTNEQTVWKRIFVGVNSVTKALENDEVKLVLVGVDVSHQILINHLLVMCKMRNVTICPLPASLIGSLFGKKSAAAVALKKRAETETTNTKMDEFITFAETLLHENMEKSNIPWLTNSTLQELNTKTVGRKRANSNTNPQVKKGKK